TSAATFATASSTQGSCSNAANQLSCSIGVLNGGASATITLTLKASGTGSFTNTASASSSQPAATSNISALVTTIANRPPTAADDFFSLYEDHSATLSVLGNDSDPDGDALSLTRVTAPAHGTATLQPGGVILYAPASDYFGSDSFAYTISDGHGGTADATVHLTVIGVNDPPSFTKGPDQTAGRNDRLHTVPGFASAITTGPANESDQTASFIVGNDNRALFAVQPSITPNGTLTFRPSGAVVARMTAIVTGTLGDDGGTANGGVDASAPQTFTITVSPNTPPTAVDDFATLNQDSFATIAVLDNDSDPDNQNNPPNPDVLTVTGASTPAHGAAVVNANNTITYTPQAGYFGPDSFTYTIDDGHAGTATATVHVTANSLNHAPVATGDHYVAREDTPLSSVATCASVNFANFGGTPGLTLNGNAAETGGVLQLVPADSFQHGSTFTNAPLGVSSFSTSFKFRMTGTGSDVGPAGHAGAGPPPGGLVFVLQTAAPTALGDFGGRIGYSGVLNGTTGMAPSIGVEFDTFQNPEYGDTDSNHVGIDINGSVFSVQARNVPGRFDDGNVWTAWIDYDGATLAVRVSEDGIRPAGPTVCRAMAIPGSARRR